MADRPQSRDKNSTLVNECSETLVAATSDVVSVLEETSTDGQASKEPDNASENTTSGCCQGTASHTSVASSLSPPSSSAALPNFLRVPVWDATLTTNRQSPSTSSSSVAVGSGTRKTKEDPMTVKSENDIKVYVETTMNELLGWYGLPKMDNLDTPQLTIGDYPVSLPQRSPSRPTLTSLTATPAAASSSPTTKRCSRKDREACTTSKLTSDTNNNSSSCGADDEDDDEDDDRDDAHNEDEVGCSAISNFQESFSVGHDGGDLVCPEQGGGGEVPDNERGVAIICSWCQQNGNKLFTLEAASGVKSFCSELCFNQCRRASFKRNKVCEWCKHVRHTLNFVDFQDGDIQLQFCSEKCLNQYKMNIFCTEARQHLQHIQNMPEVEVKKTLGNGKGDYQEKEILITPELWLSGHSNSNVAIKQEVSEEELEKRPDSGNDAKVSSKRVNDGAEPGEIQESTSRWTASVETGSNRILGSDHTSCSNEDKVGQKLKTSVTSRQRKDRLTSKPGFRTISDLCHQSDRDRVRKLLTGTNINGHAREVSPGTSSKKERTDAHPTLNQQKNASLPSALSGAAYCSQQVNSLPLLPNWATSQLLTMMPSHMNPSLAASNISSSLGSLGYMSNPLLYSSLFGSNHLSLVAQKEMAESNMAKSRNQSRRELLRDRTFETDRGTIRCESTERSTRSTSSSYSSSDTPGPPSTPGATMASVPDLTSGYNIPGFGQQMHHTLHTNNLSQSHYPPHYLVDPSLAGMFPLNYNLNNPQRSSASSAPSTSHTTASAPPPQQQHPLPPSHQQHPLPPVTILVPYPVAVPIPIPVPIPLPISPEKLFAFFKEKSAQTKPTTSAQTKPTTSAQNIQQWPNDHRSMSSMEDRSRASSVSNTINSSPVMSPQPASFSFGRHPYGSSVPVLSSSDPALILSNGRNSVDTSSTNKREIEVLKKKTISMSPCPSSAIKPMSIPHFTPDRSKKARLDYPPVCSEDEAIDLSKMSSRCSTPRTSDQCLEKDNATVVKQESFSDSDMDSSSQTSSLTVPRIRIISEHSDSILCPLSASGSMSTQPQQSSYSGRRSRILDAPSVPKKMRSPSPERRYIRTVPRDMVEAARRRGLRARVRTK